jgi:hypothetical protein
MAKGATTFKYFFIPIFDMIFKNSSFFKKSYPSLYRIMLMTTGKIDNIKTAELKERRS